MTSDIKPIKLWGKGGPNPTKVAIFLEELGLPHELIGITFAELKEPEFLKVNPNGRMPAIYDPNTDITLWESGAILEYLVERYDTKQKFSFAPGTTEAYHAKQWLYFQASGQGPYYGQLVWFLRYHSEKVPTAVERYAKEVNRVTGVLEGHLAAEKKKYGDSTGSDGPWLVGNKLSYADIAFIPWQRGVHTWLEADLFKGDDFPHVKNWLERMTSREATKRVWIVRNIERKA